MATIHFSHVTMATTDSNGWGGRSGHIYTLTRRPDGTTDVDGVHRSRGQELERS
jgi:hypothetical protein